MLIGIGTDLLRLARLRALLVRREPHQLAARILSQSELAEWEKSVSGKDEKEVERYLALR
jgi:phosphopantetheinyl transferase (holo-ACP synthase)